MPALARALAGLLAIPILLPAVPARAQDPGAASGSRRPQGTPESPYRAGRATSGIRIDGLLDERAWEDALSIGLDYEWFPGDGIPPPVATEALIAYDDRHLYAAFRCHDPDPEAIRAHLMDRDQSDTFVQDDHIVLMIDTFNDERRAFQFRVNPLGVQMDGIFSEVEESEDFSWDIIWDSAGRVTGDGYIVEMAIPLNQIRFPAGTEVQTWGFDLGRSYPRNVRHRIASNYRSRDVNCILCILDKVEGFQGMKPGRNIELDPTLTASRTDLVDGFPGGRLRPEDSDVEPGLTARWSPSADLTVHAALNPDFSQVEADVAQLEANERFALFFPEKRPFFLEGVDLFETPVNTVYTRTIRDPQWGAKITGKQGRSAWGVFAAQDQAPPLVLIPFNQLTGAYVPEEKIATGVLRYRRDVGTRSTVGVLFTGREGDLTDYHNRVGGVDGFFRLGDRNTVRFQYLRSDTRYPEESGPTSLSQPAGESFDGDAGRLEYDYLSRSWIGALVYNNRGRGFRADAGFLPRVNLQDLNLELIRRFWGTPATWYSQINTGVWAYRGEMQDGDKSDESYGVHASFSGPLQSSVGFSYEWFETLNSLEELGFPGPAGVPPPPTLFEDLRRADLSASFQPGAWLRLATYLRYGDAIDFSWNVKADQLLLIPGVEVKAGRHVNLQLDHSMNRLTASGVTLLEEHLTELRIVYQFDVRTFVRTIVQRRCTERLLSPDAEDIFGEFLFSYKINPQTVLFAGYKEERADAYLGLFADDLERIRRTFFLKLGYAWLM